MTSVRLGILGQERGWDVGRDLFGNSVGRTASGRWSGYQLGAAWVYWLGPW